MSLLPETSTLKVGDLHNLSEWKKLRREKMGELCTSVLSRHSVKFLSYVWLTCGVFCVSVNTPGKVPACADRPCMSCC